MIIPNVYLWEELRIYKTYKYNVFVVSFCLYAMNMLLISHIWD